MGLLITTGQIESIQWSNSKPILNPKLPFNFNSEDGVTIVSGFLHDGSIKTDLTAKYSNLCKELKINFAGCMQNVFGNTPCNNSGPDVVFPSIIGAIVAFGIGIKEGSKTINDVRVPDFIKFSKDEKVISAFVRQAICDEGSISISKRHRTRAIRYGTNVDVTKLNPELRQAIKENPKKYISYAPNLVKDMMFILNSLGIKADGPYFHGEHEFIDKGTGQKCYSHGWCIQITGCENLKKFQKLIALTHPKKRELLLQAINSYKRFQVRKGTALFTTLQNTLEIQIEYGFITSKLLSEKMKISLEVIQERIKRLRENNLLKFISGGYKKGLVGQESFKYIITQNGFNYLGDDYG